MPEAVDIFDWKELEKEKEQILERLKITLDIEIAM
jgi:hypothetical protein